jgi:protein-L-isoaspartate(D-aspartate) O-methyltransferase
MAGPSKAWVTGQLTRLRGQLTALPFVPGWTIPARRLDFFQSTPMMDFAQARRTMVDGQVRVNDVTNVALIAAMLEIPREKFVPEARASLAYIDEDLCVRDADGARPARYLMEPMVLARLIQALEIRPSDHVLDVGCATGYSAAVLSRLGANVVALEEDAALAKAAQKSLSGRANIEVVTGSLAAGWSRGAAYDAILLEGAVESVPEALLGQLRDGGRLAAVIRKDSAAKAALFTRSGENVTARRLFDAAIPPLPGFEAPKTFVF